MSTERVRFYMKSGNVVVIDDVKDWKFKGNNGLSSFELTYDGDIGERLIGHTIDLSQVEAVTVEKIK